MNRLKYPTTYHLEYSEGVTRDDKIQEDLTHIHGKEVVVTEKMDGENFSLYEDGFHARSLNYSHHESHNWLKQFYYKIAHNIPENVRICGENLYATHSIFYSDLESYFYGFSIWNTDVCYSWDETVRIFNELGIKTPKVLYRGIYNREKIMEAYKKESQSREIEGFVVRKSASFLYEEFSYCVLKYVRKNHVKEGEIHWSKKQLIPNKLKD